MPKKQRFDLFSADDALDPQPPIDWIVEGLFSAGSVSIVVGSGGVGKTYSFLDCLVSVANDESWLGHAVRCCIGLVIDEESGKVRLKRRLGDVMRGHGIDKGQVTIQCSSLAFLELLKEEEQKALHDLVIQTGAKFVLIDALIDILIGGDENDSTDMQMIFRGLRKIAEETQAAIVVLHHYNKSGLYRGSSAAPGAVDLMLCVEKSKKNKCELVFKSLKERDVEPFAFAATMNFGDDTFSLSSAKVIDDIVLSKSHKFVLTCLTEKDMLVKDIMARARQSEQCTPVSARKAVYDLQNMSYVERRNGGGRRTDAIFGLTEKGKNIDKQAEDHEANWDVLENIEIMNNVEWDLLDSLRKIRQQRLG